MPEPHSPDVIYLEADSEITEAIDKLKSSHGHEVRLAVPARSTLLQSAVNLKLLKKAAGAHKQLVLVSSDKATISLAAGLGILLAKNVKAEAAIPDMPMNMPEHSNEPTVIEQDEYPLPKDSGKDSASFQKRHISLTDDAEPEVEASNQEEPKPVNKNKRLAGPKVPNFGGLNKKVWLSIAGVGVLILLILGYVFLPSAKVILLAKAKKTPVEVKFTLDAGTRKSDFANSTVAADSVDTTKDLSGQFTATGQKDLGTKAGGSVKLSNASNSSAITVPAGTVLSSGGKTFTLNQSVTVPGATVSGGIVPGTATGAITASQNGESFNLGSTTFTVTGFSSGAQTITATGSTTGGMSKTATVVSQADLDKAKKDAIDQATNAAKQEVRNKVGSDEKSFEETFASEVTSFTSTAPVDSENSGGTINVRVKFSMLAAAKSELDKLFSEKINSQIPQNNQIYQSGANDSTYTVTKLESPGKAQMSASGNAFYGEKIDIAQVAKDIAGKSKKEATDVVTPKYPQISSVQVESMPALAPNLPFFADHIKIEIKVSTD